MAGRLVTVFGGSGFLGRYLIRRLAKNGDRIRVAVRNPNLALFLKPLGDVGQIQIVQANVRNKPSVEAAVAGADAVVNLVGILFESGAQKFAATQAQGAANIARACAAAGVRQLVHISAIGASAESTSKYARSKAAGEKAALDLFPATTILRPSVVFGGEDNFINRFAGLARLSPIMPLICGNTRFQPIYAGDVAEAIMKVLETASAKGKTYELGGPKTYTFRAILEYIMDEIDAKCPLVPVPVFAAKIQAFFLQLLPTPLLTIDQVKLLEHDNVVSENTKGLKELGISPTPLETVAPSYLIRFRPHGQFSDKKAG